MPLRSRPNEVIDDVAGQRTVGSPYHRPIASCGMIVVSLL